MGHSWPLFVLFSFFLHSWQHMFNINLSMIGFEPRTSGVGSNCSTNWATTTAPGDVYWIARCKHFVGKIQALFTSLSHPGYIFFLFFDSCYICESLIVIENIKFEQGVLYILYVCLDMTVLDDFISFFVRKTYLGSSLGQNPFY